jgi:hypothetical protein
MAYFLSLFQVLESSSMVYSHPSKKWELKLSETIPRSAKIVQKLEKKNKHMSVCQNLVPLVNIKIAGKWMFTPLKMVLYNRY